jgi:hypothetical protein
VHTAIIASAAALLCVTNAILADEDPFAPLRALPVVTDSMPNYVMAPEPVLHIRAEDVLRDSIRQFQIQPKGFAVRWTYTEAGAKKMLAFNESHVGEKVRITVGSYEIQARINAFQAIPPYVTNYATWKEGWLKTRTDKMFCTTADDAKRIMAGLKLE